MYENGRGCLARFEDCDGVSKGSVEDDVIDTHLNRGETVTLMSTLPAVSTNCVWVDVNCDGKFSIRGEK